MSIFIATFKTSVQITEDQYKVINPTLKITGETTVKEIEKFYNENRHGLGSIDMEILIIKTSNQ